MLHDLNGNIVSSTDKMFTGKVLLVTLWGTWCPPCISEIPTLIELQRQYRDSGLVVIAISFETEGQDDLRREQLRSFVDGYNINYMILDGGIPKNLENTLPSLKNIGGLPVEILINRGKIEVVRNGYGYSEVWAAKIKHEIKTLLKKSVN
jgi:thiol-disulfide isomerase/thioredoxin